MKTKEIVFTAPYVAKLLDTECPPPAPGEVTVETEYSTISAGTEKANFIGQRNGTNQREDDTPVFPRRVGYASAGRIVALGEGVSGYAVGDPVVVFWGHHQKLRNIPTDRIMKLPEGVSTLEASMALIATFPLGAIRKTHLEIGEGALVMGLGILGIFAVQELKAAGAYPVIAADPIAERRDFALKMGADFVLDPTAEGFSEEVIRLSDGGVPVCIEVTGLGAGLIGALDCMRSMGRVALLGCTRSSKFEIDYYAKVHGRGISLIGAHTVARPKVESSSGLWTDRDDVRTVLNLVRGGRLNFKDMISETHSPAEANEVYNRLVTEKNFPIGVAFDWSKL